MTDNNQGFIYKSRDYIAGSFAGMAQVLIGQPFDIIKVRLQSNPEAYPSAISCFKEIAQNQGFMGFYKGTSSPLAGISFYVSVQFGTQQYCQQYFSQLTNSEVLSTPYTCLSGLIAGITASSIATPVEHIRIRMQVQKGPGGYSSAFAAAQDIYTQYGLSKGIFKGGVPTVIREGLGNLFYFLIYDTCMGYIQKNTSSNFLLSSSPLICGGIAGVFFWLSTFPFDTVQSLIQTDNIANPQYQSMIHAFQEVNATRGFQGFFPGFSACMGRAVPANAGTFFVFEQIKQFIEDKNKQH